MVKENDHNNGDVNLFQKFSKNNRYRIAVEKWTIDITSLWKLTIAGVYLVTNSKKSKCRAKINGREGFRFLWFLF